MTAAALVAAIHQVIAELRVTPLLDVTDRVGGLLAQATTAGLHASLAERKQLVDAFAALGAAVAASLEKISDELRKTGATRTAMSGYGAIRPYTVAQRLRTRI